MGKKHQAIYAPGELARLRQKLGSIDPKEAKRVADILGGEIGIERAEAPKPVPAKVVREETVSLGIAGRSSAPFRRVEVVPESADRQSGTYKDRLPDRHQVIDTRDDPLVPLKISYRERLKMDRLAAQPEYEIKTNSQAFAAIWSFLRDAPDFINPVFTIQRMNEFYGKLENLVKTTRNLLPRTNEPRASDFKQESPFAFAIIDIIRKWNIEIIVKELAQLQAKPKDVVVVDYAAILKAVYRPLFLLNNINLKDHIVIAYRRLYARLCSENPACNKEMLQVSIQNALSAFEFVSTRLQILLYPLLMKFVSDSCVSYSQLLIERKRRVEAFLDLDERDRLQAPSPMESVEVVASTGNLVVDANLSDEASKDEEEIKLESEPTRQDRDSEVNLSRALIESLSTMEKLFPEAGWSRLADFPDLYPYFSNILDIGKGSELIAPNDPLQQIVVLMQVLKELFYGLRFAGFHEMETDEGDDEKAGDIVNRIAGNWNQYLEDILGKEYFPRLIEYCRLIDGTPEARTNLYAKRLIGELFWLKRLFFLPFLQLSQIGTVRPARKFELVPLFKEIRTLRRLLTRVAAGIEAGNRRGGASANAPCEGINNPWSPYLFQIANPVSERLDAILGGKNSKHCTNAALVFVTLSVVILLDSLVNDERSWAYTDPNVCPYRSLGGLGAKPLFGVDEKIDADALFRKSIRNKLAGSS